jgi:hypothetical protein
VTTIVGEQRRIVDTTRRSFRDDVSAGERGAQFGQGAEPPGSNVAALDIGRDGGDERGGLRAKLDVEGWLP